MSPWTKISWTNISTPILAHLWKEFENRICNRRLNKPARTDNIYQKILLFNK